MGCKSIASTGAQKWCASSAAAEHVRVLAVRLPRPLRFMLVGGCGLLSDVGHFTLLAGFGLPPLTARLFSLATATLVTWRLNRALTFGRSGRQQRREAIRYAAVTAVAQGVSYAIFAALALTVFAALPHAAILAGAIGGALISYNGHRLFAFAPVVPPPRLNALGGVQS